MHSLCCTFNTLALPQREQVPFSHVQALQLLTRWHLPQHVSGVGMRCKCNFPM